MLTGKYRQICRKFTISAEDVTDETRDEKLTQHIPDVTPQQWTTLAVRLHANIAEVVKEAKDHLNQHQGEEFENNHWEFWNLRRVAVERWEKELDLKRQEAIEKTFPDVKSPPVYLTCSVVPLLDEETFTYTTHRREGEPGAPGVSISHELRWKVDMDPVAPVQKSEVDKDSLEVSVLGPSQFTTVVPGNTTANMNEGDDQSGLFCPTSRVQTEDTQSVASTAQSSQR
jgi:hypothetical protein